MSILQESAERFADTSWQIHRQWSSKKTPPVNVPENNNTINPNQTITTKTKTGNKIVTIETIQTTLTPQRNNNNESGYGTLNRNVKSEERQSLTRQNSKKHDANKIIANNIDTTITDDEIIVKTEVPNNGNNHIIEYKIETIESRNESAGNRAIPDIRNGYETDKSSTYRSEKERTANHKEMRYIGNQQQDEVDTHNVVYNKESSRVNENYPQKAHTDKVSTTKSVVVKRSTYINNSPNEVDKQLSVRKACLIALIREHFAKFQFY